MTIGWANQATGTPDSSQGLDVLKGKPRFTRPFFGRADSIASHRTNNTHAVWVWRKRVGVEPTIRPAKDRIAGFEGRERHRTFFASANSIVSGLQTLKERQARWEVSVAACCVRIKAATRSYSAGAVQTS